MNTTDNNLAFDKMIKNKYSYQDCWNYAFSLNEKKNAEEIKRDIIALCQTTPEKFWLDFSNKTLSDSDYLKICYNLNKYIKKSYPVPYLTNQVVFYGSNFYIEKGVFIPQKDTEILVKKTLEIAEQHWKRKKNLKVLELGTGCGGSVISLAKNKPNWRFWTIDINKKALKVARTNVLIHQVNNVNFIQSNLFNNLNAKEKFDIIFSNPPYISEKEYRTLSLATKYQPKEALVAKNNGYFFYQEFLQKAHPFLAKKFLIIMEIGYQQGEKIIKLIIEYFPQAKVSIFPDWENRHRVIAICQS